MAKIILEFDSYEDAEELKDALAGTKNAGKLEDIWMECFRPNRKHGFSDKRISDILNNPKLEYVQRSGEIGHYGDDLIELIAEIYLGIMNED